MKRVWIVWVVLGLCFSQVGMAQVKVNTKNENLKMKYLAAMLGLGIALAEGCEQAYFFSGEQSQWDWYTKETSHIWFGVKRISMIGAGLAVSQWHPKQKLISWRTGVQWVGYWCIYSSVLNRGLRKVQTGNWFDFQNQHGYYIDIGWVRIEIDMNKEAEMVLLGSGILLLTIDYFWERF